MIELHPAPSSNGRRSVYRCECGVEFTARHTDVRNGKVKSCGCRRVRVEVPEIAVRFVPAGWWRTDEQVIGALLIALRLPFDELSFLEPIDACELRAMAGLDDLDLDRPVLRRWLESDGTRVYGVRCPASLVFGASESNEQQEAA